MGVPHLNALMKKKTTCKSIYKIKLFDLANKIITVDVNIYMYKFLAQDKLIENFHKMLKIFNQNSITPIFVFDGAPPKEKYDTLNERKKQKNEMIKKYKNIDLDKLDKHQSSIIKQSTTVVSKHHFKMVQQLFDFYNVNWIIAEGEADDTCAHMVIKGDAWACLSQDMDMFIYGCPRVLRNINLNLKSVMMYDTANILKDLELTQNTFREICVYSGTDYNKNNVNIKKSFKQYYEFCKSDCVHFKNWLYDNHLINDLESFDKCVSLFNLEDKQYFKLQIKKSKK